MQIHPPQLSIHQYAKMRGNDLILLIRALLTKINEWAKTFFFERKPNTPNMKEEKQASNIEIIQPPLQCTKSPLNEAMKSANRWILKISEKTHFPTPKYPHLQNNQFKHKASLLKHSYIPQICSFNPTLESTDQTTETHPKILDGKDLVRFWKTMQLYSESLNLLQV